MSSNAILRLLTRSLEQLAHVLIHVSICEVRSMTGPVASLELQVRTLSIGRIHLTPFENAIAPGRTL